MQSRPVSWRCSERPADKLIEYFGLEIRDKDEQVKRNIERFPADFMFQLDAEEHEALGSQIATLKPRRGQHRKYRPYVFTGGMSPDRRPKYTW